MQRVRIVEKVLANFKFVQHPALFAARSQRSQRKMIYPASTFVLNDRNWAT